MQPENASPPEMSFGTDHKGDRICGIVRRHPFGIVLMYIEAIVGLTAGIGLIYFLLTGFIDVETRSRYASIAYLSIVVIVAITVLILLLATFIYFQNRLIITGQDLTQVLQQGLFVRKTSELSMANVEDVTAEKRGIFATIFNFGNLNIETAGEQNNFHFIFCPRPDYYAKIVLDARERYINSDPDRAKRANELLNVPNQSQA